MSSYGFRERIMEVKEDGTALASSTAQTSLLPVSALEATIGAGRLKVPSALVFEFSGTMSNIVTTPGTLQFGLRLGSVDVFLSGLIALNVVAKTSLAWRLSGELITRVMGNGTIGKLFPKGCRFESYSLVGAAAPTAGSAGICMLPYNAAPAVGNGFDTTVSQLVDFNGQWSISNAGNTITCQGGSIDLYT